MASMDLSTTTTATTNITNFTTTPAPFFNNATQHTSITFVFIGFTGVSVVANGLLLTYILMHKLYLNFISSHFIAHLCLTNLICAAVLLPMFFWNVYEGSFIWQTPYACRIQVMLTCSIWTVMALMALCIAGVHLLTFARIHYEQLFGLPPSMLCALSWIISFALALPAITNAQVVKFDTDYRYCIWDDSDSGLKFLTYILILGVLIPTLFMYYAYIRVLGILYHSPIVFQSIGLYRARWLVYGFLVTPFYQLPFYLTSVTKMGRVEGGDNFMHILFMFGAFANCLISPFLYGLSLVLIKEEDMALTARAHKQGGPSTAYHPSAHHPHSPQAQLI